MNKHRILALSILIIAAVLLRFLPHPPNFTPVAALALFSGVIFRDRVMALALPLCVMLVSDLFLGWHGTILYVYGAFAVMVLLGRSLKNHATAGFIAGGGIAGALMFFLVTNFGVWMSGTMYPPTWEGLAAAYVAGIPFLHNMILGTLFYSAVFFGVFHAVERLIPSIREESGPVGA
jgi:hypothetical protein